jgi:hypothetical protein
MRKPLYKGCEIAYAPPALGADAPGQQLNLNLVWE